MFNDKKVIGICTAELDQKFEMRLLERVIRELSDLGYYVLVFGCDSDMYHLSASDLADASVFGLINTEIVDIVIIFSGTIKQKSVMMDIVRRVTDKGVPVVSISEELDGCYNIIYDTETAFEELVRHIVEYHGKREVNFISGLRGNEKAEARLAIYHQVLEDNDILFEEDRVGYGDFWSWPTYDVMEEFMDSSKVPPEAIICANDSMAIAACDYLRQHDYKVPEDILVAGIDGIEEGIKHSPAITTCVRNEVRDAKTIAGLIETLCNGKKINGTTILEYHIQLSQSCGCQKTHLFDSDKLIGELNSGLAAYRADVRLNAEMADDFLTCRTDKEFWNTAAERMPDNSFLCINSNLSYERQPEASSQTFTEKMNAIVKLNGKAERSECYSDKVVPELGKRASQEHFVIVLPIHSNDKVVGYMGLWKKPDERLDMTRTIHFLLNLDHSAGLMLAEGRRAPETR